MRPVEIVLERLGNHERRNGHFMASCPAHEDPGPSLSIKEGDDGRALLHCFAGCENAEIAAALGLKMSDLFPASANEHRNGHKKPHGKPTAVWKIRDVGGELQAEHVRYDRPGGGKECLWRLPGASGWGLKGRKLSTLPLCRSELVEEWPKDLPVVLVEGEKAANALAAVYPAVLGTVTGAEGTPGPEALEVLHGRRVVLWPDNDKPGRAHMERIAANLQGIASEVRIFKWAEAPEKGDAADHPAVVSRSREAIDELLGAMAAASEWEPDGEASIPEPAPWPTPAGEAYYGLAGDIVRKIEPHTEADPVAVLVNLLCEFGNAIGRGAYFRVGADQHHLKLNAGLVGPTSKGRKGMSEGHVRQLMHTVDAGWEEERVMSGLSSGEGLIHEVRDEVWGVDGEGVPALKDPGVSDKRLLIAEPELARVLKVMARETNTLSPIVRQAWDSGRLRVMTRNNPLKATNAHVSIIGHISKEELLRHLTETEAASGFANRFLWILVRRSKELPFGGEWHTVDTASLVQRLSEALEFGKGVGEIVWGESAKDAWREVYGPLSEGKPGLFGAVVGRAEAQTVRLAALYAVMNRSKAIEFDHLAAALALWGYAEDSARYIFGDAAGDPVADRILEALRAAGNEGMTRTEIRDLFGRNKKTERIDQALVLLLKLARARRDREDTGGRPSERWFPK